MENNTDKKYILEVKNLRKYFPIATNFFGKPTCYLKAVNNVSFSLEKGKTIGVVGESGCGKTTLGRTILKLYEPNEGQIIFDGHDITKISKNEMRILHLLMKNRNSIISREELMTDLWQTDEFVDDNTLTVNINRLRKKLESVGLKDYIVTKRGQGYMA